MSWNRKHSHILTRCYLFRLPSLSQGSFGAPTSTQSPKKSQMKEGWMFFKKNLNLRSIQAELLYHKIRKTSYGENILSLCKLFCHFQRKITKKTNLNEVFASFWRSESLKIFEHQLLKLVSTRTFLLSIIDLYTFDHVFTWMSQHYTT